MIKAIRNVFWHPLNTQKPFFTLLKVLWWKLNQIFFRVPAIVPVSNKFSIMCYPQSSLGSFIFYARWPEYDEMSFINSYLRTADTYIDVGAHIGPELLVAATTVEKGKLFGFEPTKKIYDELTTNIRLNNLHKKIMVYPWAVSDRNGVARFIMEKESEVNHLDTKDGEKNNHATKVKTITLDSFASQKRIKTIHLLKIDTEGAEHKVLQGAQSLLEQKRIWALIFEVGPRLNMFGTTEKEVLTFLNKNGYRLYAFDHNRLKKIHPKTYASGQTTNLLAILPQRAVLQRIKALL